MAGLTSGFEGDLRGAVGDAIEQRAEDLADELRAGIQDRLQEYGQRHDYDVRALVAGVEAEVVREGDGTVRIVARLPHPALLFERGTVDHVVEAKQADVLSFIWERRHDPPQWVREEFQREGDGWRVFLPSVEVSGLPEGRFVRDTLHDIRRMLET